MPCLQPSWLHFVRIRSLRFVVTRTALTTSAEGLHLGSLHLRHLSQIRVPISGRLQIRYACGEVISLRFAGIYLMHELSGNQSSNLGNCCIIQRSEDFSNPPKPWAEIVSLGRAMAAKAWPVFDAKWEKCWVADSVALISPSTLVSSCKNSDSGWEMFCKQREEQSVAQRKACVLPGKCQHDPTSFLSSKNSWPFAPSIGLH